jgi:2-methylcitrate dehydratase PrpD
MALGANMSSGTEQYVYDRGRCETKDLISGFAARNGVFATRLARHDFYGPRNALGGEYGFFRAFGEGFDPAEFEDLGEDFVITTTAFKPHGGCRHTHQAVDAVQNLLQQIQPDPGEIERIVVRTYQYALQPSFRTDPNPGSREVAGLSIRVATALALVRHSTWPDDYEHWDDPAVRRLRQLVEVEIDPEIESVYPESNGCRVLVTLKGGRTYEGYTPYAKGEPELSMSETELKEKFKALTREILDSDQSDALFELCMNLETVQDVGELLQLTAVR